MKRMNENGLTQSEVATRLDISQPELSKIIHGKNKPPDPKRVTGERFYKKLAKLEGVKSTDVLISKVRSERVPTLKRDLPIESKLSKQQKESLNRILLNIAGAEDSLPLIEATLKSFIENVKGFSWIEDKNDLAKMRRQRKLKS